MVRDLWGSEDDQNPEFQKIDNISKTVRRSDVVMKLKKLRQAILRLYSREKFCSINIYGEITYSMKNRLFSRNIRQNESKCIFCRYGNEGYENLHRLTPKLLENGF